jgi:prevent-host-death family protein
MHVGAFEAKTKLSALLDRVEKGEEIVITRNGKEVARMVPVGGGEEKAQRRARAVEELMAFREKFAGRGITQEEILDWIAEGRR